MTAVPLKTKIVQALDDLPPESLTVVADFVEFLRAKAAPQPQPKRITRLGGLWQGYTFSEADIQAARHEVRAGLGRGLNG